MKSVVIDTNVFLVCISHRSIIHKLFLAINAGEIEVCVSNSILMEYREIIERYRGKKYSEEVLELLFDIPNLIFINVSYRWDLIQLDVDDNKFVDCAIAANAQYIVTGDRHFNVLKTLDFLNLSVITAYEFQKILTQTF